MTAPLHILRRLFGRFRAKPAAPPAEPAGRGALSVELHRLHGEALQAAKSAAGKASGAARRGDEQATISSPVHSEPDTRQKVADAQTTAAGAA